MRIELPRGRMPEETLLLEPGRYFIAYFKSSYLREATLGRMEHYPVNIDVAVKGLEYQ